MCQYLIWLSCEQKHLKIEYSSSMKASGRGTQHRRAGTGGTPLLVGFLFFALLWVKATTVVRGINRGSVATSAFVLSWLSRKRVSRCFSNLTPVSQQEQLYENTNSMVTMTHFNDLCDIQIWSKSKVGWLVSNWLLMSCQMHRITWGQCKKKSIMEIGMSWKQTNKQKTVRFLLLFSCRRVVCCKTSDDWMWQWQEPSTSWCLWVILPPWVTTSQSIRCWATFDPGNKYPWSCCTQTVCCSVLSLSCFGCV